jgi:hypothetical protein
MFQMLNKALIFKLIQTLEFKLKNTAWVNPITKKMKMFMLIKRKRKMKMKMKNKKKKKKKTTKTIVLNSLKMMKN